MKLDAWNRLDQYFSGVLAEAGRPLVVASEQPSEAEIASAESELGCKFDPDYATFLRRYGGATIGAMPVFGLRPVEVMGNPWSMVEITREYRSQQWPGTIRWYVVSEDGYGNPIGIDPNGRVFLSDHDSGEIIEMAPSFEAFLLDLYSRAKPSD